MNLLKKVAAIVVVVLAGAWAYYANVSSGRPSMDMNMRIASGSIPFPVMLAPVERGSITGTVTYTGSVAAFNEEDIYPRVTGRIVEMPVYPGDRVERGQVVARLDDIELTSRVREAEGMLATSQANRLQMEADLIAARHGVRQMEKELAMAEAESGYQQLVAARDEQLFAKGAISQQDAENSRAMAAASRAKVEAAQAKVEQAQAMETSARKKLEASDAMVAQGKAQVNTAQVVRDYVTIVAPSTGYVVKRLVAPGVLVQPGMAILKTTQVDKVRLQANVGERDLPLIRVGSPVAVTTIGNTLPPFGARVSSVFPFVDQGARTAVVEAVVQNDGRRLLPGQYVQMQFVTGERKDVLTVPRGAVARMGGKATVWVLKGEDQVEPVEVTTGLESPERVEILKGLDGGERVVARGHEGLYAGARVSDVSAANPAPQEATDAHKGMPGMGEAPAKPQEPEKASEMKGMPGRGAGTQVAQAGGTVAPAGKLQINLANNPVKLSSGNAKLRFEVKDAAGAPVSDAKVEINAVMAGMTVPKVTGRAVKEPGVYEATVNLGMAGAWTIEVTATRPQGGSKSSKFNIEVK
jgi:multidrug efflux pump subunit AcrA (membrane-fusion protein)